MPDEGVNMKEIVRPIILAQGNTFIKELLRDNGITIGATKADFEKNLFEAIDAGQLTHEMVELWLHKVEGWGDQHVYLFAPPAVDWAGIEAAIRGSQHGSLLDVSFSYAFPDRLALTAARLSAGELSVDWHLGTGAWERAKSKDYQDLIDGDRYEFRAYRDRSDRIVVRFEWRFDRPYCCLFTQLANEGDQHAITRRQVFDDLQAMSVLPGPLPPILLSQAVKSSSRDALLVAHSTKMSTPGGYVDFVATTDAGIGGVEAVRRARAGVQDSDFGSAEGVLSFRTAAHPTLSRDIKATVYGSDGRFRVWAQCKRDDIYAVADHIWRKNT